MTIALHVLGAGLACAVGGAIAGNALGSAPVLDRSTLTTLYQSHETVAKAESDRTLPDHYPLVTRAGTVPVAALSERGLYSQARYRAFMAVDDAPRQPEPAAWEPENWAEPAPPAPEQATDEPAFEEAEPAEPLQLAAGAAGVTATGGAKLVKVSAALAM